jgi:thiopurine S-methyltransferase
MNPEFWHKRWQRGEIGWHEDDINRHLTEYWPRLGLPADTRVLVPLCGKSLDMLWLAGLGHRVLGVEISPLAADAFFAENALAPRIDRLPPFSRYRADEIELLVGDFFDLRSDHLRDVAAVYDRASLIALPPGVRPRYAQHLASLLAPGVQSLLVTLHYDQTRMQGPPFSVEDAEVCALFEPYFSVETLVELDALAESPRFKRRGLDWLIERVHRLRVLAPAR